MAKEETSVIYPPRSKLFYLRPSTWTSDFVHFNLLNNIGFCNGATESMSFMFN